MNSRDQGFGNDSLSYAHSWDFNGDTSLTCGTNQRIISRRQRTSRNIQFITSLSFHSQFFSFLLLILFYMLSFGIHFRKISSLKSIMFCPLSPFLFRDLSFGIRKLHQIHFVFLLIVLGYQSLFLFSSFSFSLDLISIAGKEFTSHRI